MQKNKRDSSSRGFFFFYFISHEKKKHRGLDANSRALKFLLSLNAAGGTLIEYN